MEQIFWRNRSNCMRKSYLRLEDSRLNKNLILKCLWIDACRQNTIDTLRWPSRSIPIDRSRDVANPRGWSTPFRSQSWLMPLSVPSDLSFYADFKKNWLRFPVLQGTSEKKVFLVCRVTLYGMLMEFCGRNYADAVWRVSDFIWLAFFVSFCGQHEVLKWNLVETCESVKSERAVRRSCAGIGLTKSIYSWRLSSSGKS